VCVVLLVFIVQCAAVSSAALGLVLVGGRPGFLCAAACSWGDSRATCAWVRWADFVLCAILFHSSVRAAVGGVSVLCDWVFMLCRWGHWDSTT